MVPRLGIRRGDMSRLRSVKGIAVPLEMVEALALVGPRDKIRKDLKRYHASVASTLVARGRLQDLEVFADLMAESSRAAVG